MKKMAKKTRAQKVLADTRHFTYHLETPAQESSPSARKAEYKLNLAPTRPLQGANNYAYVVTDLRKTALITGANLITQLVLYFALNRG